MRFRLVLYITTFGKEVAVETAIKKRKMFFRSVGKINLYRGVDPLRVLVYLAEIDKFKEFAPKKGLYKTTEVRVKILTELGVKKRAIHYARLFVTEENNFPAHNALIKTLIRFHYFTEAVNEARAFTEKRIGKKYDTLLAMAFHADFEQGKTRDSVEKISLVESTKSSLRTMYYWVMTSPMVIQLRVLLDLRGRELRKHKNRWKYWFKRTISFWRRSKRKEASADGSSAEQN